MTKARTYLLVAGALLAACALWLLLRSPDRKEHEGIASANAVRDEVVPKALPVEVKPTVAQPSTPLPTAQQRAGNTTPGGLPAPGTHASRRVLAKAKHGPAADQLGLEVPQGEGYTYPPQSFVPTPDGKLLVLDNAKMRLAWFGKDGSMERTMALPTSDLEMPAGLTITKDGTIAIVDRQGVQTKGTLLIDANGNKKGAFPQLSTHTMGDVYAVGNDIYATSDGAFSIKLGDTSGAPDDETPGIYRQEEDGRVPGLIAPDGRTVISMGTDDHVTFWVSAMSGVPPQHKFTRFYRFPFAGKPGVGYTLFAQADPQGRIYLVILYDQDMALVCLDGTTGDAVGLVPMDRSQGDGAMQFTEFRVMETGGLIHQRSTEQGSTYELYNCHP